MQTRFTFKAFCAMAIFTVGTSLAHAGNNDFCFEDGLKTPPWTPPAPAIHFDHHGGHGGWGHAQNDWHFDWKHHSWKGWGDHGWNNGSGTGVSPIPEPQTDAMLLAGLVMLATLVRRKSKTGAR